MAVTSHAPITLLVINCTRVLSDADQSNQPMHEPRYYDLRNATAVMQL